LHHSESYLLFFALSLQNQKHDQNSQLHSLSFCGSSRRLSLCGKSMALIPLWEEHQSRKSQSKEERCTSQDRQLTMQNLRGARRVYDIISESYADLKLKFCPHQRLNIFAQLCGKSLHDTCARETFQKNSIIRRFPRRPEKRRPERRRLR
jgi:hypothetical protein